MAVPDWKYIYENWGTIIELISSRLDTTSHVALNDNGEWVKTNRPMIEDIHECKVHKIPRFAGYLIALETNPKETIKREGRNVYVSAGNKIQVRQKSQ